MYCRHFIALIFLVMRITIVQFCLLFIFSINSFGNNVYGQNEILNKEISLNFKDVEIKKVLTEIEKSLNVKFVYSPTFIQTNKKISIKVHKKRLYEVIDQVLFTLDIKYELGEGGIIYLLPIEKKNIDKLDNILPNVVITGNISSVDGKMLYKASIKVKGTSKGTVTDENGNFSLSLSSKDSVLIVSYTGYETQEVRINGERSYKIGLVALPLILDDVVIIGYGVQKKRDVTGAISSVSAKQITERAPLDVFDAIQGQAAGVQIAAESGRPGASSSIRIRGTSTFEGGTDPLYVVDGVQGVNIDGINPADIESIEILKDAASAAIYGSRSANGVILITTKKGKNPKVKIDLHEVTGFNNLIRRLPQATAADRRLLDKERAISSFNTPIDVNDSLNPANNADNDYQSLMTKQGIRNQVDLSFSGGGGKNLNYYGSVGVQNVNGILLNSWSNITRGRFNIEYKPNENLTMTTRIQGSYRVENIIRDTSIIVSALLRPAYYRIYLANGSLATPLQSGGVVNPVLQLLAEKNNNTVYDFSLSNSINYRISKDLKFSVDGNIVSTTSNNLYFAPYSISTSNPQSNLLNYKTGAKTSWQAQAYLNYSKQFARLSNLTATFGVSADQRYSNSLLLSGINLVSESILNINSATLKYPSTSTESKNFANAVFGRIGYSYLGRYIFNSTVRTDASSVFAAKNRWGVFPSASFAWRFSEESFMNDAKKYLNDAKLRISYGLTGNDNIGNYDQFTRYGLGTSYYNGISGVSTLPTKGNPNLSWESTTQLNVGTDLTFLNGNITLALDYYNKKTRDLLYTAPFPASSGYSSVKVNVGEVRNSGVEYMITVSPIKKKDFNWTISYNMAFNFNRVNKLYAGTDLLPGTPSIWKVSEGGHIGDFYGYKALGVYAYNESNAYSKNWDRLTPVFNNNVFTGYTLNGKPYTDEVHQHYVNGIPERGGDMIWQNTIKDSVIDDKDRVILGNAIPKWTAGLSNQINYKQFIFSFNVYISWGGTIYNDIRQSLNANITNGTTPEPDFIHGAWVKQGDQTIYPSSVINTGLENGREGSSLYFEDATFIRLRNARLTYLINSRLLSKYKIGGLSVFGYGNNLFVWTKYKGYDPELAFGSVLTPGIDSGKYPHSRELGFGINVTF